MLFPTPKTLPDLHVSIPTSERKEAPHFVILIDILPNGASEEPSEVPLQPWAESHNVVHISRYPRRLAYIDPTVTFVAPSPLPAQSQFTVYSGEAILHTEIAPLAIPVDTRMSSTSGVLHCAALVPGYWETLLQSPGTLYSRPSCCKFQSW